MKSNNKFYKMLLAMVAICTLFNPSVLFAQGNGDDLYPCGGTDPYATCPLDTWVIVLAAIALLFAAVHLHRKQKVSAAPKA